MRICILLLLSCSTSLFGQNALYHEIILSIYKSLPQGSTKPYLLMHEASIPSFTMETKTKAYKEFSKYLSENEFNQMLNTKDTTIFWDTNKLPGIECVDSTNYYSEEQIIHYFSIPLLNQDNTYCIIYASDAQNSWIFTGGGCLYLLKLDGKAWNVISRANCFDG